MPTAVAPLSRPPPKFGKNGVRVGPHGDGLHGLPYDRAFDTWSAHVRYFLARYPLDSRHFIAQRVAAYGIRSLLSSHRQEDLTIDAVAAVTARANEEVLTLMRQHARGRRMRGTSVETQPITGLGRSKAPANVTRLQSPREALRERTRSGYVNERRRPDVPRPKRHAVAGRPDVLTRYPFVDDLRGENGGGVGGALHGAVPTTPVQHLAKREIRRLAHEAFAELKASALGIRLSDLPTALQFLFFGDSASLLTAKGAGSDDRTRRHDPAVRTAEDVHLIMALAREALPATLALAAHDTSTLSSASTADAMEGAWTRDAQNMFVDERRWMKLVAHVVRRLWKMDGHVGDGGTTAPVRPGVAPKALRSSAAAAAMPAGLGATDFEQPAWRPTGGKPAGRRTAAERTGNGQNRERDLGSPRPWEASGLDSTWGSAAPTSTDGIDGPLGLRQGHQDEEEEAAALHAWEHGPGDEEDALHWVGAGRSMAWGPKGETEPGDGPGSNAVEGRASVARMPGRDGRVQRARNGGEKEGTRPAGMWEVTPPPHVSMMRRTVGKGQRRDGRPAHLRAVQSRIGPQIGAHRERLRKIARARDSAVRDVVARRRLEQLDGLGLGGGAGGDTTRQPRGNSEGEHALDIADAFLESSLMTRLAGGDWFGSEDGSLELSTSAWEIDGAVKYPRPRGRGTLANAWGVRDRRSRSPGDDSPRGANPSRPSHTGWLGDFGPPHTRTVLELPEDEEEDGQGADLGGAMGRAVDAVSEAKDEERSAGREGVDSAEGDGERGGESVWVSGGADHGNGSSDAVSPPGRQSPRNTVGSGSGGAAGGAGDAIDSTAAVASHGFNPEASAVDSSERSVDPGAARSAATGSSEAVGENERASEGAGAESAGIDANLDPLSSGPSGAYSPPVSDGAGAFAGGVGPGAAVRIHEGSPDSGIRAMHSGGSAGGYTGATTGSWWEEDRSSIDPASSEDDSDNR